MGRRTILCLVATLAALVGTSGAESLTLHPTRDTAVSGHPREAEYNNGRGTRLRTAALQGDDSGFVLIDFDREALADFIERHGEDVSAKLVLHVRQVQGGPATIEVGALDSSADWNEGRGAFGPAQEGEATARMAQHGLESWATPDGREVDTFRDLFYDPTTGEINMVLNRSTIEVEEADRLEAVEIVLDPELLAHMANSEHCRGLILFHRTEGAKADFFSREQRGREPKLVVTAE